MTTREKAIAIYKDAVAAVHPSQLLRKYIAANAQQIRIGNRQFDRQAIGRLVVIAVGKAAAAMATEAEEILGEAITYGLCITKHGHALSLSQLVIIEAGHPYPDRESVQAALHIQQITEGAAENDILLFLLSGGASSLVADLPIGCNLNDLQLMNELLVNSGASIKEINTVRKHASCLKGGKLAALAMPAQVFTLAISDVTDDDVSVIGSGLTVPDTTTYQDAIDVLKRYQLLESIPASIKVHLQKGLNNEIPANPQPGDACFTNSQFYLVANNSIATKAAQAAAEKLGYHSMIFKTALTDDVIESSRLLIQQFKDYRGLVPACFILGGEPTLKVEGDGKGGRCQHYVLNALQEMNRCGGADIRNALTILAAGTDGTDGNTNAAGAIADLQTLQTITSAPVQINDHLARFDSNNYFEQMGGLLVTGPTQTNAGDIILLMVE